MDAAQFDPRGAVRFRGHGGHQDIIGTHWAFAPNQQVAQAFTKSAGIFAAMKGDVVKWGTLSNKYKGYLSRKNR